MADPNETLGKLIGIGVVAALAGRGIAWFLNRCKGITVKGKRCERTVRLGRSYCHDHEDQCPPDERPKLWRRILKI